MVHSPATTSIRTRVLTGAGLVLLGVVLAFGVSELWWTAALSQEKFAADGIPNFGVIDEHVFRGAQPTPLGFETLQRLGVRTVVRLSMGEEGSAAEEREVTQRGMAFVNLPWSTQHEPTPEQVVSYLTVMRNSRSERVFVHCKAGSDRTGVMVALYRITFNGWSPREAIAEMQAFHYRPLFLPKLQHFVEQFPGALASNAELRGLARDTAF